MCFLISIKLRIIISHLLACLAMSPNLMSMEAFITTLVLCVKEEPHSSMVDGEVLIFSMIMLKSQRYVLEQFYYYQISIICLSFIYFLFAPNHLNLFICIWSMLIIRNITWIANISVNGKQSELLLSTLSSREWLLRV